MASPVVIVSGLGAPRFVAVAYGRALELYGGLRTFAAPQRLLGFGDIRVAARLVGEEVARARRATGVDKVHLVGMSLGGLIGLYYVKCMDGARFVDCFVSVGGPLNGSTLARAAEAIPFGAVHAIAQTTPDNDLMRAVRAAKAPSGVRMVSVGTRGDVLTPRKSWDVAGLEPIETPYGVCPVGHWMLFLDPRNQAVVARCLTGA